MLLVSANLCWQMPCPIPGDLPNPGIEPASLTSPALAGGFFTSSTTWEAPIIWHLKQIGKVKMLTQWVLHELTRNLKNHLFWSVVFSYFTQQWTISLSDYDVQQKVDFILQTAMTSSVTGPERSSKALPKGKTAPQEGHGHCLVVCCWSVPLQLSEFRWHHYIWEVCSANWWDELKTAMPAPGIGQQNGPNSPHNTWPHVTQPMLQKLNKLGYEVLSHLPYSPDLSPTDYHFFKHLNNLLQGKCFRNQQEGENEFVKSRSTDFYTTEINKFFSCWQKCVDCNGSYSD